MPRRPASLVAALLLAVGCSRGPGRPTPRPTATPSIRSSVDLRTIPAGLDALRDRTAAQLGDLLRDVYARAFLPPLPAPAASPKASGPPPTPVPRPPVPELLTEPARGAWPAAADAFSSGAHVSVRSGRVTASGVVAVDGQTPVDGYLKVEMIATGTLTPPPGDPLGSRSRRARLTQTGTVHVVLTDAGWRIGGWDVALAVEREVPGLTPNPVAVARWMPVDDSEHALARGARRAAQEAEAA